MRAAIILASAIFLIATPAFADQYVRGYTRQDGTYVQPHYRSSPDGNPFNNYSTQGNVNWRLRIYEVLATPAHGWLWLCAKLVGYEFSCGPADDPNVSPDRRPVP